MNGNFTPTTQETVSGIFIDLANPQASDLKIEDIAWALSRQARYAGHTMCKIPYTVAQHTVMVSRYVEEALTPGTHLHEVFLKYVVDKMFYYKITKEDKVEFERWSDIEDQVKDIPADLRQMYAFHGLMHDFAEAYLVDLPTPVKRLPGIYEPYKAVEKRMDALIYETFGLRYSETWYPKHWAVGLVMVAWADAYALLIEAYHFMPSRGRSWNIPLERPSLSMIYNFRWPVPNVQAYEELLVRYAELKPVVQID